MQILNVIIFEFFVNQFLHFYSNCIRYLKTFKHFKIKRQQIYRFFSIINNILFYIIIIKIVIFNFIVHVNVCHFLKVQHKVEHEFSIFVSTMHCFFDFEILYQSRRCMSLIYLNNTINFFGNLILYAIQSFSFNLN